MSLTEILAIWGAVLSSLLAIFKTFEYCRDRANIKVTVKGNYKALNKDNPYGDATILTITAANIGRRPVTLKTAALLMPRGKGPYLLCADPISNALSAIEIKEGQFRDYNLNEDIVKSKYDLTPDKYVACVYDATGKVYWSHNWLKRWWKLGRIK